MDSLSEKIDASCWRIATRLSVSGKADTGTIAYFDLHTRLVDLANFHRDVLRIDGGNEETVHHALAFIEEMLVSPLGGASQPALWFGTTLHTLMTIVYAKGKVQDGGKAFLKELSKSIKALQA
jgi:hypothetical protein